MKQKNFLICLKQISERVTICYGTLFRVKRTQNGLLAVCDKCGAEHIVRDVSI
jgi:transcription elongation factor Elf1